ncbi:MAG: alpha/beta hydrolase [Gammaproteobacteria bacterium]|nr:alpha/beta hydrolase [Gammaproteobacteria bacterium]
MSETAKKEDCLPPRYTFSNDGLTLSYLDNKVDSTDIPIVMLHGFTASAQSNWFDTGWFNAFTCRGRRVIALDARGHGYSDKPYDSGYYPSDRMMEDSVTLLSELGIKQADFVGFSMGARMSAFAAIKYPQRVRKLLLGGMGINLINGVGNPKPIADALLADDFKSVKSRKARRFRRLAERGGSDLTALAYCITSSRQQITPIDLQLIEAQTLVIVGDEDEVGGSAKELSPYIRNSTYVDVAKCNHFNALTHPDFVENSINFISAKDMLKR